jgi:hypothetical protein
MPGPRHRIEPGIVFMSLLPHPAFFQVTECLSAGNPERPSAEDCRVLEVLYLADDDDEHVLEQIISVGRTHKASQVTPQRRLNAAKESFERVAVATLRAEYPKLLSGRRVHAAP